MVTPVLLLKMLQRALRYALRAQRMTARTVCSLTSFFATFSKYPSHILLNLSLTSFSTSSSSSLVSAGNDPFAFAFASYVAVDESVPSSDDAEICLEVVGGVIPR